MLLRLFSLEVAPIFHIKVRFLQLSSSSVVVVHRKMHERCRILELWSTVGGLFVLF